MGEMNFFYIKNVYPECIYCFRRSVIYALFLFQEAKGRGFLVVDYLKNNNSAENYLENLHSSNITYNPFNLILLEPGNQ